MTRRSRAILFLIAAAVVAGFYISSTLDMQPFGGSGHPYRDLALAAAADHDTANAVASVVFDQRGLDTLVEETIMLASVVGAAALLRPAQGEEERRVPDTGRILNSTEFVGYLMLPLTALVGIDLVAHGHLTPGGGFQGGVVFATAIHLVYVAGSFRGVERFRPVAAYRIAEAVGAAGFVTLGLTGSVVSAAFLSNFLPTGRFGHLVSAGTVPVFNGIVAVEIAASVVVLVAHFLDQEITVRVDRGKSGGSS